MLLRIITLILTFSLLTQPVLAFSLMDEATQKILSETWDAQTFDGLKNGIITIPEATINDYLAATLPDYPSIKAAHVAIHNDNHLGVEVNTQQTGRVKLDGKITKFVQNKDESAAQMVIGERKLLDKPIVSWFFGHISLGMMTKLLGNPLNNNQDKFTTSIDGNTVDINFKPYVDQSSLKTVSLYGMTPADLFSVDYVTTEEGILYLHTSYHGPAAIMPLLQKLFGTL